MMQEGAPRLWSAEEPHLYVLTLSLLGPDGHVYEAESTQVGRSSPGSSPALHARECTHTVPCPLVCS